MTLVQNVWVFLVVNMVSSVVRVNSSLLHCLLPRHMFDPEIDCVQTQKPNANVPYNLIFTYRSTLFPEKL